MNAISESKIRLYSQLIQLLGKDILALLEDDDVNEIMLNPDSCVWVNRQLVGQVCESFLSKEDALSIIHLVAGIHELVITRLNPRLEAKFPVFNQLKNERFTAQIPPIVESPTFTIRKHLGIVILLDEYVSTGRMTQKQADFLNECIRDRKNILVCGAPGSGKSTVVNTLISEAEKINPTQRFLILEDVTELMCGAKNQIRMITSDEVDMRSLVRTGMRMRPDRILIGEVRGGEALDMLKAWNTGCPGGICTVHANGAEEAVQRILDLSMETGLTVPPIQLVKHTIHVIVSVVRHGNQNGFIEDIVMIGANDHAGFTFKKCE